VKIKQMSDHGTNEATDVERAGVLEEEVSRRKALERTLKQTEAFYAHLVENAHDIIYKIDLQGRFTFCNPASQRATGFSGAELMGKSYLDLIHPDDQSAAAALYRSQYEKEVESTYFEFQMIRKDGGKVWIGQNVQLIKDGKGIVGFHAVARDITRQKESEKGLKKAQAALEDKIRERTVELENANHKLKIEVEQRRDSEKKLTRALSDLEFLSLTAMEFFALPPDEDVYRLIGKRLREIATDAIVIINDYDQDANRFFTKAVNGLGKYTERVLELLGKNPVGMITEMHDQEARKILESGKLSHGPEGLHRLTFGAIPKPVCYALEKILGIDRIFVIGFSKKGALFGSAIIITRENPNGESLLARSEMIETFINQAAVALQRKRFETALRESESRYRLLAENATDVIWTLSLETLRFTYISPSVLAMRGFTPKEAMDLSLDKHLAPESLKSLRQLLSEELGVDGTEGIDPNRSRTRELEHFLKDGSLAWAEATMTFVRDKKGRPVSVLGITRDIRDRKRAEAEKRALTEKLQQARQMEAIATLAGGIAHQFNNALAVIMGRLELLESDPVKECQNVIGPMKATADRMAELTNQLLAYARGGKYQSKSVNMGDFVKKTLPLIRHIIKPSVSFEMSLDPSASSVNMDSTQMQMVLSAALFNASESMDGEGNIFISCKNEMIGNDKAAKFPGLKTGPYVKLTVTDNGKGMDEETKNRIFEPFFTTKFQGRGLGMAAAYGIVKNHNGWIGADSAPGQGTRLTIYLPALEPKADEVAQDRPSIKRGFGTILLIEDDEMVMEVTREGIQKMGYEVLTAATGREGVKLLETMKRRIDLVLLDFRLPDMNAKQVYLKLKARRPDIKVVVCSGYSIDGPIQEILEAGADGFLKKPFRFAALFRKISEILQVQ
jgi:two-component system cell cycle sensor histidine kinase/response regulator CckA